MSYRRAKVSHHKRFANAKVKCERLNREAPEGVAYDLLVSETSPYMPHEIWVTDHRKVAI